MTETDHTHLVRCAELAEAALSSNNDPFGSILVADMQFWPLPCRRDGRAGCPDALDCI